jgi:hypothetical protein
MGIVRILYKRDWAAVGSGPQPIRVWGGATLAVGCYLPLAAAPNPNWLSQPIGLGLGEAQPLALLPPLAAGPRGSSPPSLGSAAPGGCRPPQPSRPGRRRQQHPEPRPHRPRCRLQPLQPMAQSVPTGPRQILPPSTRPRRPNPLAGLGSDGLRRQVLDS